MRALGLSTLAVIVSMLALATAGAQVQLYAGGTDYQVYCASCHGDAAHGDGVLAKSLRRHPADLTELAKHNDGVFPEEKVVKFIDGSDPAVAHSGSDMPAWGDVFAKTSDSAGPEAAALRINTLVRYLRTLQVQ